MIKGDEVSESAKAVQEVAKTTKAGIEATEKLGGFISRIIGEPIDEAVGFLTDKLRYSRWEQRQRLTERAKQFIEEKGIKGELRPVPPKIALPIIEHASLEDNNELQDLWARLIASAVDPDYDGTIRAAFTDILKELEVNDVHILNFIYRQYEDWNERYKEDLRSRSGSKVKINNLDTNGCPVSSSLILKRIKIDEGRYEESIDNLIRVRCVASFISNESVNIPAEKRRSSPFPSIEDSVFNRFARQNSEEINFSITHIYDKVCITPLGLSFAKACMERENKVEENLGNKQTTENEG